MSHVARVSLANIHPSIRSPAFSRTGRTEWRSFLLPCVFVALFFFLLPFVVLLRFAILRSSLEAVVCVPSGPAGTLFIDGGGIFQTSRAAHSGDPQCVCVWSVLPRLLSLNRTDCPFRLHTQPRERNELLK